jgi:hypothetical protein
MIGTLIVYAFEDIEFSQVRPVGGSGFPNSGPSATALRHVPEYDKHHAKSIK